MGGLALARDGMPSRSRRMYEVKKLTIVNYLPTTVSWGPYSCTRIPITGVVTLGAGGMTIDADERVFFPINAPVAANDKLRCIETNTMWIAVYVQDWSDHFEVYVKRSTAPIAGGATT